MLVRNHEHASVQVRLIGPFRTRPANQEARAAILWLQARATSPAQAKRQRRPPVALGDASGDPLDPTPGARGVAWGSHSRRPPATESKGQLRSRMPRHLFSARCRILLLPLRNLPVCVRTFADGRRTLPIVCLQNETLGLVMPPSGSLTRSAANRVAESAQHTANRTKNKVIK
jgi:hypothetical protein